MIGLNESNLAIFGSEESQITNRINFVCVCYFSISACQEQRIHRVRFDR